MKKSILIIATIGLALSLTSCKKKEQERKDEVSPYSEPCHDLNMIKGKVWKPIFNGCDSIRVGNDGKFYVSGNYVGTWTFDNCSRFDVANQTVPANNYFFYIYKLKPDSLDVTTATFGCKNFHL